jgi:hypothetical protein
MRIYTKIRKHAPSLVKIRQRTRHTKTYRQAFLRAHLQRNSLRVRRSETGSGQAAAIRYITRALNTDCAGSATAQVRYEGPLTSARSVCSRCMGVRYAGLPRTRHLA